MCETPCSVCFCIRVSVCVCVCESECVCLSVCVIVLPIGGQQLKRDNKSKQAAGKTHYLRVLNDGSYPVERLCT